MISSRGNVLIFRTMVYWHKQYSTQNTSHSYAGYAALGSRECHAEFDFSRRGTRVTVLATLSQTPVWLLLFLKHSPDNAVSVNWRGTECLAARCLRQLANTL